MGVNETTTWSKHIKLKNRTSECSHLLEFISNCLEKLQVSKEFKHDIKLVSEELLANIVNHGYDIGSNESIDIEFAADNNSVHLTFTDSAKEFNPLKRESPVVLNDLSEGGMGILLVKSLTDEQHYTRDNNHNVLTVTKNYNK